MSQNKNYKSPTAPQEEDNQPLAVLRLHWKKIFFAGAAIILLIWAIAVLGEGLLSAGGRRVTAPARFAQMPVTVSAQVTFVRDEIALRNTGDGIVVMLVEPGDRVAVDQRMAVLSGNLQQAEALSQQTALEQRLRWLNEASEALHYHALNVEQLGRQVEDTFLDFLRTLERGMGPQLPGRQELFLQRATTLEAALGGQLDFASEIAQAEAQLAALRNQTTPGSFRYIEAPASGHYYPTADGLEAVFRPEALRNITVDGFRELLEEDPCDADGIGRLVAGFRWYAVSLMELGAAQQLQAGARYNVMFPMESAREFPMRVERIHRGSDEYAVVVLSSIDKDDTIQSLRTAHAEIILDTVEGLQVPAAALRFVPKGEGARQRTVPAVYITRGGRLLLREVEVLHQDAQTAIVAWGNLREAQAVYGDRIVIEGHIQSVVEARENRLLVLGQRLTLTGEQLNATPFIPGGSTTLITTQRRLFDETIITGRDLRVERIDDETIAIYGENFVFREQRGTNLKIHDSVLVEGRIGRDDPTTIPEGG